MAISSTQISLIREAKRLRVIADAQGDTKLSGVLSRAIAGEPVCLTAVVALLNAEQAVEQADTHMTTKPVNETGSWLPESLPLALIARPVTVKAPTAEDRIRFQESKKNKE